MQGLGDDTVALLDVLVDGLLDVPRCIKVLSPLPYVACGGAAFPSDGGFWCAFLFPICCWNTPELAPKRLEGVPGRPDKHRKAQRVCQSTAVTVSLRFV